MQPNLRVVASRKMDLHNVLENKLGYGAAGVLEPGA